MKRGFEPVAWCEVCERGLREGEFVLKVEAAAVICMNCYCEMDKRELAEALRGVFEEL